MTAYCMKVIIIVINLILRRTGMMHIFALWWCSNALIRVRKRLNFNLPIIQVTFVTNLPEVFLHLPGLSNFELFKIDTFRFHFIEWVRVCLADKWLEKVACPSIKIFLSWMTRRQFFFFLAQLIIINNYYQGF